MDNKIKTIPLLDIPGALPCVFTDLENKQISENHPALSVMTDFSLVKPITVEPLLGTQLALEKMKSSGVRLLLVTDEQDHIAGIITSYDIQSEKPVQYAENHGISHADIQVSMIMTRLEETPAFDLDYVQQSLVRHVINTMQELNRPHTLVIETAETGQVIRGMFSTSQISRVLGRPIYRPLHSAQSLADLQQKIAQD